MSGPHIYDNALADLEQELVEGGPGLLELEQGDPAWPDPTATFGMSMTGLNRHALLARCGFMPNGVAYVRFTSMNVDTGEQTEIGAETNETGLFVAAD